MANQGTNSTSILDFPMEIIDGIARLMDADTFASVASFDGRFRNCAGPVVERLKVSFINEHLLSLLTQYGAKVRFLDLSNCHGDSSTILSLISKCLSLKELNVVNSGLKFLHLLEALGRLKNLERLSFSLLDRLNATPSQEKFPVFSLLRDLYLETTTPRTLITTAMLFINNYTVLEKLHINLIGIREHRTDEHDVLNIAPIDLRPELRHSLKTVIVSCHASSSPLVDLILDQLFKTRLEEQQFLAWRDQNRSCYIYEDGNINMHDFTLEDKDDVLRDALYVERHPEDKTERELQWGAPRGLKLKCDLSSAERPYRLLGTLKLSMLKELDLTECHWRFTEGEWTDLLISLSHLEALAISSDYLMKAPGMGNSSNAEFIGPHPEQPYLGFDFLLPLRWVKLKQLWITGSPATTDHSLTSESFSGLKHLSHLEELTLHKVHAKATQFGDLAHDNVRIIRLHLHDVYSVTGLEDMIKRSPKLKFFKLYSRKLQLDCVDLWSALKSGNHVLKQICLATKLTKELNVEYLLGCLPPLIEQLEVLHIHAPCAQNHAKLEKQLSAMMKKYVEDNPYRNFQFLPVTKVSLGRIQSTDVTASFPGRSLCANTHYIARVKADGWDLRL